MYIQLSVTIIHNYTPISTSLECWNGVVQARNVENRYNYMQVTIRESETMAEIGQETVKLSTLVTRTAEESYVSFKELVEKCMEPELSDTEKKISMLKYIVKTQQRMLRLNVLAKWCQQVQFYYTTFYYPTLFLDIQLIYECVLCICTSIDCL